MKKYLGLAVVVGTVGLALACTVTSTNTTDGGVVDTDTGTGEVDSGIKPDAKPKAETGPLSCYDAEKAGAYKTGPIALNQGKANSTDINAFFDACFATGTTQATCEAYTGTKGAGKNTAVVNCIFPFYNPDLTQAVLDALPGYAAIPVGENGLALNVGTCRALAVNAPTGCAQKYNDSRQCLGNACDTCEADADFTSCIDEASKDGCANVIPEAACDTAVTNGAAAADALCGPASIDYNDNAKFKASFIAIATAFCGSPG